MRTVVAAFLLVLAGGALGTTNASASEPHDSVRLAYRRGAGAERCPDEAALRDAVAMKLGYDPFSQGAARRLSASVERDGRHLHAHVEIRDAAGRPQGARDLVTGTTDCDELVSSMALAMSIAINPLAAVPAPPPPAPERAPAAVTAERSLASPSVSSAAPATATAAAPAYAAPATAAAPANSPAPAVGLRPHSPLAPEPEPENAPPVPEAPRRASGPAAFAVQTTLGGIVSYGSEPGVGVGATLDVTLRWPVFSLAIEGRDEIGGSATARTGGEVRASLLGGSPIACLHRGVASVCAAGVFGSLQGSGSGVMGPQARSTFYAAAGARLGLEIPWSDTFSMGARADLLAILVRTTLGFGGTDVWTTAPLSAGLSLTATASFR